MKHKVSSFNWELAHDDIAKKSLTDFLTKTSFILEQCQPPYSTQLNEFYDSIEFNYLEKEIAGRKTAFAQFCCV